MSSVNDILRLAAEFESTIQKLGKPSFIADQKIWNRAKKVTKKHWKDYENPYPIVIKVYKNMGGKIKKKKKSASIEHLIAKYALNANTIPQEVKRALQSAIGNASTVKSNGILPFVSMLAKDHATLSINITRTKDDVAVSAATVNPGEFAPKYAALPQQIEAYLKRNLGVFPTVKDGESIDYNNTTVSLQFGSQGAVAINTKSVSKY